jgi:pimeloyl-ACP methyl ester carboxylesterase
VVAVELVCGVALSLASRISARVRSMMLVNPGDPARLRGDDFAAAERLAARHLLDAAHGMVGAATMLGPILERSVASPASMPPALLGRYAAPFVGREGVRHLMQIQRAINDQAMTGVTWEKIAAPVRVVRGDSDSWVEPQVAATRVAPSTRRAPGAWLVRPDWFPKRAPALVRCCASGAAHTHTRLSSDHKTRRRDRLAFTDVYHPQTRINEH